MKKKNISDLAANSKTISEFSEKYVKRLSAIFSDINKQKILELEKLINLARIENRNIFVFGNGGAAATATTMANDLGFDILKKTKVKKTFKVFCLNDNTSVLTAIANDVGYENIFLNQLKIHFRKKDIAIILSASGNSKNIVKAANWIKKKNSYVFSIVGFDGGKLKKISNNYIHIPSIKGEYGPVEDIQLMINHILAHWFQKKFKNS